MATEDDLMLINEDLHFGFYQDGEWIDMGPIQFIELPSTRMSRFKNWVFRTFKLSLP